MNYAFNGDSSGISNYGAGFNGLTLPQNDGQYERDPLIKPEQRQWKKRQAVEPKQEVNPV